MATESNEKISKLGLKKEKGYLYYLDDHGDVYRVKVEYQGRKSQAAEFIAKCGISQKEGFLYFIDGDGDVSRSPVAV